jgi:hypothetical protein
MYPCSACDRHLRDTERACPFCGAVQSTVTLPTVEGLGAFSLAVLLLGASACSKDTVSATTTSESGSSSTESGSTGTTVSDSSDSSEGSTFTDTDDTTNTTDNTSGSFYAGPSPDYALPAECDPFVQDCAEGEKCVPYASNGGSWDSTKCVPILGDGQPGEPCVYGGTVEATDDCGAESYCWNTMDVEGEAIGVCTEFCQGTPDDPICVPGSACLISNEASVTLCVPTCDPLLQDCGPGTACYWHETIFICIFTSQEVPLGEPCGYINDCAGGLACMPNEVVPNCGSTSCCASYCSLMEAAPCEAMGAECSPFFDQGMAPLGYEDVGVCILPGA